MKLNSTENDDCDRTMGDMMLMTTLSHRMDDTAATRNDNHLRQLDDHEEVFFVELNSREMPIDCPEGYEASVKSRPSVASCVDHNAAGASNGLNRNMLIKPILSMLLKSGSKVGRKATQQHKTIELAMDTIEKSRNLVNTSGEINNCFVMDSSGEEKSPKPRNQFSSSSTTDKSTSSLTQANQQLLLSSPSSTSSTSLIKSEFINNLNGGDITSTTAYVATHTSTGSPQAAPASLVEFNQNIVIKSVEIGGAVGDAITSTMTNLVLMTSSPGASNQTNIERMLDGLGGEQTPGLTERIVMAKKLFVEKGFKSNLEHDHNTKLINTSDTDDFKHDPPKLNEILNNLDYSKQSTNSIENNQLINNTGHNNSSSCSSLTPQKRSKSDDEDDHDADEQFDEKMLSDEGRFLLKKAQYYCVDNLKLVNIEKLDAPLGATIKNRDGSIVISRIVIGGAAQKSGLLHENDEILEINSIPVRGKTINDICDMLFNMQGIISFLIIPNMMGEEEAAAAAQAEFTQEKKPIENRLKANLHLRALFNYSPGEDLYIPCKELGLEFSKGDILHVISQNDQDWWQAYKDGSSEKDPNALARLIPSQVFQERRFSQIKAIIGDSFMTRKKREKGICVRGIHSSRRRHALFGVPEGNLSDIVTYEEVTLYRPPPNRKRPIVLIGPHNIGRHELRKRLMQTHPSMFEVAVPHTTRAPRREEIDGKDYHFLPRHIFEADIKQGRFVEHGEYEKNLYGTSREAIKKVIENSKICVLNLYPQALKALRCSDLMPYVIYIGPPNLVKLKELKTKTNEAYRESDLLDIIDKGREIEEMYGHYFDKTIRNVDMDKTYKELFETIENVQNEENWVPTSWLGK